MKFGTGSICLSKIPKDKITKGKDGNSYINIVIRENKDGAIYYGNTHSIELAQSKEERSAQEATIYLGNAKDWDSGKSQSQSQPKSEPLINAAEVQRSESDDLPF